MMMMMMAMVVVVVVRSVGYPRHTPDAWKPKH